MTARWDSEGPALKLRLYEDGGMMCQQSIPGQVRCVFISGQPEWEADFGKDQPLGVFQTLDEAKLAVQRVYGQIVYQWGVRG